MCVAVWHLLPFSPRDSLPTSSPSGPHPADPKPPASQPTAASGQTHPSRSLVVDPLGLRTIWLYMLCIFIICINIDL